MLNKTRFLVEHRLALFKYNPLRGKSAVRSLSSNYFTEKKMYTNTAVLRTLLNSSNFENKLFLYNRNALSICTPLLRTVGTQTNSDSVANENIELSDPKINKTEDIIPSVVSISSNTAKLLQPKEIYFNESDISEHVQKQFSSPKNKLHNIYDVVCKETKEKSYKLSPSYKLVSDKKKSMWVCTYHVLWPEEMKFLAKDVTKAKASHNAALAALNWLKKQNKITKDTLPILYETDEVKKVAKEMVPVLQLDAETVDNLRVITELHHSTIVPHIIQSRLDKVETTSDGEEDMGPIKEPNDIDLKSVKKQRFLGISQYSAKEKVDLPISAYKEQFIELLQTNQTLIVKGEPGCGKSTRIPQYVLEAWAREDGLSGESGRIAVTQPRRIAAISLAERVANERNEPVGHVIGYQVRLNSKFRPATGRILYCTTGILLRHLQTDLELRQFTHVILDEAHERDVNTDLLMSLLRTATKKNPRLKLIVMSATIDTDVFSEYYGDVPVMEIPGFTYPVKQHFLDNCSLDVNKTIKMCAGETPSVVHEDVVKVIQHIHQKKPEGAILCFLPGWEDIQKVYRMIPERGDVVTYCLHSRLQDAEQWKIFSHPPPGVRKIILATNIAETSVTIDDVVYVIDTGIHKEQRFDVEKGINCIDNHWISKASATQRKGRAGRVQSGECFHLYPKSNHNTFEDYSLPEILRTSLTKIILDCKLFSNNMNALEFMGQLPTPPEENAIVKAVEELKDLELLDRDENLTTLGKTVAEFPLEPKLSKAMVNAVVFKCITPIVDIVTLFSADTELFASGLLYKEQICTTKKQFSTTSDHLAMMRIFEKWLEIEESGERTKLERFCHHANLLPNKMSLLTKLRKIHFDYIYNGLYAVMPFSDDLSDNDEMVKAVLYSGVGNVLHHRNWAISKNKLKKNVDVLLTRNNHKATITHESVNHRRNTYPSCFLLYINETRSNIRRMSIVRECSLIPKISVLLFSNKELGIKDVEAEGMSSSLDSKEQVKLVLEGTNIELICDKTQAEEIVKCRDAVMSGYRYFITQLTDIGQENAEVNTTWDQILSLLGKVIQKNKIPIN